MFLSAWFLLAGATAAAGMVAAHLIVRGRTSRPLPTTRFVALVGRATPVVQRRPRDLALLAIRAGALLLAAVALAGPTATPRAGAAISVVLVDSAGAADPQAVLDSARAFAGAEGTVVFAVAGNDRAGSDGRSGPPAKGSGPHSLSPGLIAAIREAGRFNARGHPVEITIVSPLLEGSVDSATRRVRELWPGSIELMEVPARQPQPAVGGSLSFRGAATDPLDVALSLLPAAAPGGRDVRVVRGMLSVADSAAARAGATVVHWPARGSPARFQQRTPADTVAGLVAGDRVMIARFARPRRLDVRDTAWGADASEASARWIDGEPAAVQTPLGSGCVREVAVEVPDEGDLLISREFLGVLRELVSPCDRYPAPARLSADLRAMLEGPGPARRSMALAGFARRASPLSVFLLAIAVLLLLAEPLLRGRGER